MYSEQQGHASECMSQRRGLSAESVSSMLMAPISHAATWHNLEDFVKMHVTSVMWQTVMRADSCLVTAAI